MKPGDQVPDFEAFDQTGATVHLADLTADGPVVLFFYPRAMTRGCTAESRHFRDLAAELRAVGARAVGISADSVERQARFDEQSSLGLPLLSDPDRRIAAAFGVKRPGPLLNRRMTFVIGPDRRLVEAIRSEISMDRHADRALEVLRGRPAGDAG
ncbi:MAG TPA: peroxiredoxin [Acidimicrobiales bacterium]|nr:peroxiredoxin [Acidimicrobiales bacterium]